MQSRENLHTLCAVKHFLETYLKLPLAEICSRSSAFCLLVVFCKIRNIIFDFVFFYSRYKNTKYIFFGFLIISLSPLRRDHHRFKITLKLILDWIIYISIMCRPGMFSLLDRAFSSGPTTNCRFQSWKKIILTPTNLFASPEALTDWFC